MTTLLEVFFSMYKEDYIPELIIEDIQTIFETSRDYNKQVDGKHYTKKYDITSIRSLYKQSNIDVKNTLTSKQIIDILLPSKQHEYHLLYPILFNNVDISITLTYLLCYLEYYNTELLHQINKTLNIEYKQNIIPRFSKIYYYFIPILFKYRYPNILLEIIQKKITEDLDMRSTVYSMCFDDMFCISTTNKSDKNIYTQKYITTNTYTTIEDTLELDDVEYKQFIKHRYSRFRSLYDRFGKNIYIDKIDKIMFKRGICYNTRFHTEFVESFKTSISGVCYITAVLYSVDNLLVYMCYTIEEWYNYVKSKGFMLCVNDSKISDMNTAKNTRYKIIDLQYIQQLLDILKLHKSKNTQETQKQQLLILMIEEHIKILKKSTISYLLYNLSVLYGDDYKILKDYIHVLSSDVVDEKSWVVLSIKEHYEGECKSIGIDYIHKNVIKLLRSNKLYKMIDIEEFNLAEICNKYDDSKGDVVRDDKTIWKKLYREMCVI